MALDRARAVPKIEAVRLASDQNELQYTADWLETPRGTRKRKRLIRNRFPNEYRAAP
jgi:hypothetical protein